MINAEGLSDFGHDPWWLVLVKVLAVFVFLMVMTVLAIWFERRVVGRMQVRPGPNRNGPFGLLQSLADGLKLIFKEEVIPKGADRAVYFLAPVISGTCAFTAFAVMPFGPVTNLFGTDSPLQLADMPVAVLLVLACSSMGVYGVVLAGWASGSTYPLLGGLRSSAQMISYEVAMGLSIVAVFMMAGSMSTSEIVSAQSHGGNFKIAGLSLPSPGWYVILLLPSFVIYFMAAVGETNRAPFDLPEAESELVGGFHTEYSSMKFMMFYLAEYINMITVSGLCTTLFLGGWRLPVVDQWLPWVNGYGLPVVWFTVKVTALLFVFVWLRGTLPRLRYDQFMRFGWKVLIPANLVWILALAGFRVLQQGNYETAFRMKVIIGVAAVVLLILMIWPAAKARTSGLAQPEPAGRIGGSGGFPLPPLDLVVPQTPRARRLARAAVAADDRDQASDGSGTDAGEEG